MNNQPKAYPYEGLKMAKKPALAPKGFTKT